MEDIVVSTKQGGYIVKYPYQDQFDFYASSSIALVTALKNIKSAYVPAVYEVQTWYTKPKLTKLTKSRVEQLKKNVEEYLKFK